MKVTVDGVTIPAWSTVGYGTGLDERGVRVEFVGDHRPMRELGERMEEEFGPIEAEVEPWQLIDRESDLHLPGIREVES